MASSSYVDPSETVEKHRRKVESLKELRREVTAKQDELLNSLDKIHKELVNIDHSYAESKKHLLSAEKALGTAEVLPWPIVRPVSLRPVPLCLVSGPANTTEGNATTFADVLCAKSVTTYPTLNGHIQASPICDAYNVRIFERAAVLTICDGCNWGRGPMEAARRASSAFTKIVVQGLRELRTARDAVNLLLKAARSAHGSIFEGKNAEEEADTGTTTLLGGLVVPVVPIDQLMAELLPEMEQKEMRKRIMENRSGSDSVTSLPPFSAQTPCSDASVSEPAPDPKKELCSAPSSSEVASASEKQHRGSVSTNPLKTALDFVKIRSRGRSSSGPASFSENDDSPQVPSSDDELTSPNRCWVSSRKPKQRPANVGRASSLRTFGPSTVLTSRTKQLVETNCKPLWALVLLGIGDCKCFHWHADTGEVSDVTAGSRPNNLDPTDPGGRLGAWIDGRLPDLRNLKVYFSLCGDNDLVFLTSDGVTDNLDPFMLGCSPEDMGFEGVDSWAQAIQKDAKAVNVAQQAYLLRKFSSIIDPEHRSRMRHRKHSSSSKSKSRSRSSSRRRSHQGCRSDHKNKGGTDIFEPKGSRSSDEVKSAEATVILNPPDSASGDSTATSDINTSPTVSQYYEQRISKPSPRGPAPFAATERLLHHCLKTTASSRHFMENECGRLPDDHKLFPGKMDHSTCVCLRICPDFARAAVECGESVAPLPVEIVMAGGPQFSAVGEVGDGSASNLTLRDAQLLLDKADEQTLEDLCLERGLLVERRDSSTTRIKALLASGWRGPLPTFSTRPPKSDDVASDDLGLGLSLAL